MINKHLLFAIVNIPSILSIGFKTVKKFFIVLLFAIVNIPSILSIGFKTVKKFFIVRLTLLQYIFMWNIQHDHLLAFCMEV